MKRLLLLPVLLLAACAGETDAPDEAPATVAEDPAGALLGEAVPDGVALSPDELIANADEYAGKTIVVEGVAREVCQQAGCWLTFADAEGRTVRINVPRDENESYVFTFPTDASGRTVRVAGVLEVETTSVADQKHYAEDGGASEEEIAAITAPKQTLVLTALGAELATEDDATSGLAPA